MTIDREKMLKAIDKFGQHLDEAVFEFPNHEMSVFDQDTQESLMYATMLLFIDNFEKHIMLDNVIQGENYFKEFIDDEEIKILKFIKCNAH